jgi:hypothetical protein
LNKVNLDLYVQREIQPPQFVWTEQKVVGDYTVTLLCNQVQDLKSMTDLMIEQGKQLNTSQYPRKYRYTDDIKKSDYMGLAIDRPHNIHLIPLS